jgi:hypothetical protein
MKDSGYPATFRHGVIEAGLTAYKRRVERDVAGTCPLYRPKGYLAVERNKKREVGKMGWYRPYDTVLFCPPTPAVALARA